LVAGQDVEALGDFWDSWLVLCLSRWDVRIPAFLARTVGSTWWWSATSMDW